MSVLQYIKISNFLLQNGQFVNIDVSFQVFGPTIGMAPIVVVNHALTGNSNVSGSNGWWNNLIGENKVIDLKKYTVLAFNIPGNGYDEKIENLIENYKIFSTKDMAMLFWKALEYLKVSQLYAVIGGSLGGALAWEMAFIKPRQIQHIIPIAANWKANDWVIGHVLAQDIILNNSTNPIFNARVHAMLFYRTPQSLVQKFQGKKRDNKAIYEIESWLEYHGKKLTERFQLPAYKLMNHLLKTIGQYTEENDLLALVEKSFLKIHQIAIRSDYFFIPDENYKTHERLKNYSNRITLNTINSIHGHDAFLIEYKQLEKFLNPIFNK